MINEVLEVKDYLEGKNIQNNDCTFRMCTLLAKYFHSQGLRPVEIREKIFKWANSYGIYIKHNVNDLIKIALSDETPLFSENIYLNSQDIEEIKSRFDSKNVRLCALGLLLYSKSHADRNGEFNFSQIDFGKWLNIKQPHVSEYFNELEMFEYVKRIYPNGDQTFMWNGKIVGKKITYKIEVSYKNEGDYLVADNDIRKVYSELFEKR